jgi:hypothetical protein
MIERISINFFRFFMNIVSWIVRWLHKNDGYMANNRLKCFEHGADIQINWWWFVCIT